jgi:CRP-like cAMP-binding protein
MLDLKVPQSLLKSFAEFFVEVELESGHILFSRSSFANGAFLVRKGEVHLDFGEDKQSIVKEGELFGLESLHPAEMPRNCTATLLSSASLLFLPRESYDGSSTFGRLPAVLEEHELIQKMALLKKISFLRNAPSSELRCIASTVVVQSFDLGEVIFDAGDSSEELYVLFSGCAQLSNEIFGDDQAFEARCDSCTALADLEFFETLPRRSTAFVPLGSESTNTADATAAEESINIHSRSVPAKSYFLVIERATFENFIAPCCRAELDSLIHKLTLGSLIRVPFFRRMRAASLDLLATDSSRTVLSFGERLFQTGDPTHGANGHVYVVEFGTLDVLRQGGGGVQKLQPGSWFGAGALLGGICREVTVRGEEECDQQAKQQTTAPRGNSWTAGVVLALSRSVFETVLSLEPAAKAECLFDLRGIDIDLLSLLNHRKALYLFELHLREVYNEESLLFWIAVDEYEKNFGSSRDSLVVQDQKALSIVENFLRAESTQCVNISANLRVKIENAAKNGQLSANLFEDAKAECFRLMVNNDFEPFKESKSFQGLVQARNPFDATPFFRSQDSSVTDQLRRSTLTTRRASTGNSAKSASVGLEFARRVSLGS